MSIPRSEQAPQEPTTPEQELHEAPPVSKKHQKIEHEIKHTRAEREVKERYSTQDARYLNDHLHGISRAVRTPGLGLRRLWRGITGEVGREVEKRSQEITLNEHEQQMLTELFEHSAEEIGNDEHLDDAERAAYRNLFERIRHNEGLFKRVLSSDAGKAIWGKRLVGGLTLGGVATFLAKNVTGRAVRMIAPVAGGLGLGAFYGGINARVRESRAQWSGREWARFLAQDPQGYEDRIAVVERAIREKKAMGDSEEALMLVMQLRAAREAVFARQEKPSSPENQAEAVLSGIERRNSYEPLPMSGDRRALYDRIITQKKDVIRHKMWTGALRGGIWGAGIGALVSAMHWASQEMLERHATEASSLPQTHAGAPSAAGHAPESVAAPRLQPEVLGHPTGYHVTVESGDGTTHLARKAIHDYLTNAHDQLEQAKHDFQGPNKAVLVYAEDWLRRRLPEAHLGNELTISTSKIEEALLRAREVLHSHGGHGLDNVNEHWVPKISSHTWEKLGNYNHHFLGSPHNELHITAPHSAFAEAAARAANAPLRAYEQWNPLPGAQDPPWWSMPEYHYAAGGALGIFTAKYGLGDKRRETESVGTISATPPTKQEEVAATTPVTPPKEESSDELAQQQTQSEESILANEYFANVDFNAPDVPETRRLAAITLARVGTWKDLNAPSRTEGDEKFKAQTQALWKEIATHGQVETKPDGTITVKNMTDLDANAAIWLLQKAGIKVNIKTVRYIRPNAPPEPGYIHLDVGGKKGVVVEQGGSTAFIDHHTSKYDRESSTAKYTYEALKQLGLIEPSEALDRFVAFITMKDSKNYTVEPDYYKRSARTLLGLQNKISYANLERIARFFEEERDVKAPLTDAQLRQLGFVYKNNKTGKTIDKSKDQSVVVRRTLEALDRWEKEGFVINSDRYGKIVVNLGEGGIDGFDGARSRGYDTYIIWSPQRKSFFISSTKEITDEFGQGVHVRGTMVIKPDFDQTPLAVSLKDVLQKMTDGKLVPTGELKAYLSDPDGYFEKRNLKVGAEVEKGDTAWRVREIYLDEGPSNPKYSFQAVRVGNTDVEGLKILHIAKRDTIDDALKLDQNDLKKIAALKPPDVQDQSEPPDASNPGSTNPGPSPDADPTTQSAEEKIKPPLLEQFEGIEPGSFIEDNGTFWLLIRRGNGGGITVYGYPDRRTAKSKSTNGFENGIPKDQYNFKKGSLGGERRISIR